ncbi:patatin-like phospholipase family protein [Stylonychia lemnae]|uniref:Patatin-like phospholipase family protein n=1 Tax=Stylonychia lemnae TaxID=5949 RepID=A0A077ZZX7_STYLE|nr:patatin-like phospholipase family protein [Stylonychia lemnae]|eukprot:CDW75177.1 patatin-like phospholipase family protein [Stylonychia lemnae]
MQLSIDPIFEKIDNPSLNSIRLDKKYSVLSLDGGGVKGLMTCRVLEKIEQEFRLSTGNRNFKIIDAFDCVIGTSVGGLIAVALVAGYSAKKLAHAMSRMMPHIFQDEFDITDILDNFNDKVLKIPIQSKQLITVGYNEQGLEEQLRKYLFSENPDDFVYGDPKSSSILRGLGDKATLQDLKERNPRVRLLLTAVNVHQDEINGPMYSPRIFDTENPDDLSKTILSVSRATSAAPTFFKPSEVFDKIPVTLANLRPLQEGLTEKEKKQVPEQKNRVFVDGGLFANNPASWGLLLASTKVKIENIRMLSIGTSYPKLETNTPHGCCDDAGNILDVKRYLRSALDKVLELIHVKEDGKVKTGLLSGSLQALNMVALDLQKTSEQILDLFKPIMGGQYFRFNPPTPNEIGIDNPEKRGLMNHSVEQYFEGADVRKRTKQAVECLLKEEDYQVKVVAQLRSALSLLEYANHLDQKPSDEVIQEQAAFARLIQQQFASVKVSKDQVQKAADQVKHEFSLYTDDVCDHLEVKEEEDGPSTQSSSNQSSDTVQQEEEKKDQQSDSSKAGQQKQPQQKNQQNSTETKDQEVKPKEQQQQQQEQQNQSSQ